MQSFGKGRNKILQCTREEISVNPLDKQMNIGVHEH